MSNQAAIVGVWKMTIAQTATSPEALETMQTFFADGNYLETNNNPAAGSTGHGVWIGADETYHYTFQVFVSDAQGNYSGKRVIRTTIQMDSPDHYTGQGTGDVIDLAGNVTKNVFAAPIEGARMKVEQA
jgi:secreted PhoX family phosphatase